MAATDIRQDKLPTAFQRQFAIRTRKLEKFLTPNGISFLISNARVPISEIFILLPTTVKFILVAVLEYNFEMFPTYIAYSYQYHRLLSLHSHFTHIIDTQIQPTETIVFSLNLSRLPCYCFSSNFYQFPESIEILLRIPP